jgi:hypothetical protein
MIHSDRHRISSPLDPALIARAKLRIAQWFDIAQAERHRQKPDFPERFSIGQEARTALGKLFYRKCAYCESPVDGDTSGEIDRFRPFADATNLSGQGSADHYIWLFADWENLYLACSSCNRAKRTLFPVEGERARPLTPHNVAHDAERALLIDPCLDEPSDHLAFLETGTVEPLSGKGEVTIKVLNLNRPDLVDARRNAWQQTWLAAQHLDPGEEHLKLYAPDKSYAATVLAACKALDSEQKPLRMRDSGFRSSPHIAERRTAEEILAADADAFRLTARPLRRVHITNFRALRDVDLTFAEPSAEHAPWLMLLGENATGKSSVLQAIALALAGADEARRHVLPSQLLSVGAFEGSVVVWFWDRDAPAELRFRRDSNRFEGARGASAIVLGYGALRYSERRRRIHEAGPNFSQIAPLMHPVARIRYPGGWLLALDAARFDTAVRALQNVLPLGNNAKMWRTKSRLFFEVDGHNATLSQLSAGYQTIIGMCADVMRLLFARWDTLSSATAIVLVDELDAHLHPRWSMRVVQALRDAFPQVQFVASTHDPLTLRGLRNGEVVLLRRDDDGRVVADQRLPALEGLQVDQILTSRVFGLDSTMDPETEALFGEFYHLRSLPADPARDARIAEIRGRVGDREALGRSDTERLMLQAAAEFVHETSASPDADLALRGETLARLREIAARGAVTRRRPTQ